MSTRKIVEVKDDGAVSYLRFDSRTSSRASLTDNINLATDFTGKVHDLKQAIKSVDLKSAKFQSFSGIKADEVNVVELKVTVEVVSRVPASV